MKCTLIVSFILSVLLAACRPTQEPLLPAVTAPVLPTYVAPTQVPIPTPIASRHLDPGSSLTVTDGQGKYAWIYYRGQGVWQCVTNAPNAGCTIKQDDNVWAKKNMFWGSDEESFASVYDGTIYFTSRWNITTENINLAP